MHICKEDNLKNEVDLKNEDNLKNEDYISFCLYSVILGNALSTAAVWSFFNS